MRLLRQLLWVVRKAFARAWHSSEWPTRVALAICWTFTALVLITLPTDFAFPAEAFAGFAVLMAFGALYELFATRREIRLFRRLSDVHAAGGTEDDLSPEERARLERARRRNNKIVGTV